MHISAFDDLLRIATEQVAPQRLLLVFCKAELPEDASDRQKAEFEAGEGGVLVPVASVDKFPEALGSFTHLVAETAQHGIAWDVVFVAAMDRSQDDNPQELAQVDQTLEAMVAAVKAAQVGNCIAFNPSGVVVALGH